MAEIQQEPIYLNYGNDAQIEQNDFLNAVSNNVEGYLASQPWSKKRKDLFRAAYLDIMSRGVTGASNASGVWNVHHNGNLIDLESLSKKEREMYGEAAYFIQLLMSGLPTKLSKEAEAAKKKAELPVFNNAYLTQQFQGYIGNNMFGGRDWDRSTDWNTLDEADKNGIRGITNRASKLADMLEGYASTLKEGEHNFEGSPFTDLNDFKSRIAAAVTALRSPDPNDDRDALNRIGLNINDYLSTGADDIVTVGDKLMTRAEAATALELMEQLLQQQLTQEQTQEGQQLLDNTYFAKVARGKISILGATPEELSKKFHSEEELFQAMNELASKGVLTTEDWNDVTGAYKLFSKNGKLLNLSSEEINMFRKLPGYLNLSQGVLKKIDGIEGFYFDTRTNLVIQPFTKQMLDALSSISTGDLLLQNSPEARGLAYLNKPLDFSGEEWTELGAILGDIVSIVDPEPISAAVLGAGSATARTAALASTKKKANESWGLGDYLGVAGDYITGVIGAVPFVGDAALAAKVVRNLRRVAGFAAIKDMISNAPDIKQIFEDKILGDLSMTVGDWKKIAEFLRGVVGGKQLLKSNLALRQVMKARGVDLKELDSAASAASKLKKVRGWGLKYGVFSSIPRKGTKSYSVKVKVDGKETEIPISSETKSNFEKALRKAGNDLAVKNDEVRKLQEVLDYAKTQKVDTEKITVISEPRSIRNNRFTSRFTGKYSDSFTSEKVVPELKKTKSDEEFEQWLGGRSTWEKIKYGDTKTMQAIDRNLFGNTPIARGTTSQETKSDKTNSETKSITNDGFTNPTRRMAREYRNTIERATNPKGSTKGIRLVDGKAESNIKINGKDIKFTYTKGADGKYELKIDNAGKISTHDVDSKNLDFDVKKLVAKTIEEARSAGRISARSSKTKNDLNMKELIQQVRKLKRQGFLLKGGIIEKDTDIIISEFLKRQK